MYEEYIENIKLLSGKRNRIFDQAKTEHRKLTAREAGLMAEIDEEIDEQRKNLPANSPLSLEGGSISARLGINGPFKNLGEQLRAVVKAGIPGGQVDQRLYNAASGLNETVPSEGGFLLQQDFSTQLLQAAMSEAVIAPRCNRIGLSGNANSIKLPAVDETSRVDGSRWGGVESYWEGEADKFTGTKPKFRQMELILKKLTGICYSTDELLQDAAVLEKVVTQAFTDEISFRVDDGIIRGSGAGQMLGILNSGALVSVPKETGQVKNTVTIDNCVKIFSRMPARNRRNAIWLINQAVEPQLYTMSLAVGTGGGPVFLPSGGASAEPYMTLFGRPLIAIEQCSALGTLGDILFIDPSAYILVDKGGIQSAVSIHVRFEYDESVFRFVYRVDGQPSWAASLTPFKGSNAVSPFVGLADRIV